MPEGSVVGGVTDVVRGRSARGGPCRPRLARVVLVVDDVEVVVVDDDVAPTSSEFENADAEPSIPIARIQTRCGPVGTPVKSGMFVGLHPPAGHSTSDCTAAVTSPGGLGLVQVSQ